MRLHLIKKIKNQLESLKVGYLSYTQAKGDVSYKNWYNLYKPLGCKYDLRHDESYLEWLLHDRDKIRKYTNIHEGEDCFILCNGPSLNKIDLNKLNGYHLIGLNKIYLIFEKVKLDLSYLICVNGIVIEQAFEEFKKINCPVFLSSNHRIGYSKNINYIRTDGDFGFTTSFDESIKEGHTVTHVALQVAFIMGFKRVFIVGADHYFHQKGIPNSEQVLMDSDKNHFHPDYFKGQKWNLADLEGNEISYRIAKKRYAESGLQIFNATIGGNLEIFQRIKFEEALSIAKMKK
jgi:hypothetical protein